jgi:3-hydroxyacyl-[acyl-carrier-protein] dehydratase
MILDTNGIQKILPHRYPFLLVDSIVEMERTKRIVGVLLFQEIPDREKKLLYFVAIDGARFRRPVVPGDQLRMEMTVVSWRKDFCKLAGKATVDGEVAAEATLMCKMVDRDP